MWCGDLDRAETLLTEAKRRAAGHANGLGHIYARGHLALVPVQRDDPGAAETHVEEAEHAVRETLSDEHFVAMVPALARARLPAPSPSDRERRATAGAEAAVELARRGAGRVELAGALLTAAR